MQAHTGRTVKLADGSQLQDYQHDRAIHESKIYASNYLWDGDMRRLDRNGRVRPGGGHRTRSRPRQDDSEGREWHTRGNQLIHAISRNVAGMRRCMLLCEHHKNQGLDVSRFRLQS